METLAGMCGDTEQWCHPCAGLTKDTGYLWGLDNPVRRVKGSCEIKQQSPVPAPPDVQSACKL